MRRGDERRAKRQANYERLNRPEVLAAAAVMDAIDHTYLNPDMWGRYATNKEKAAALIDAGWTGPNPEMKPESTSLQGDNHA